MAEDFRRLVLDTAAVSRQKSGWRICRKGGENAVLQRMRFTSAVFHRGRRKVFVEKLVGTHVIAFIGINTGEGAQQNGKGAVTSRFMMRRTRRSQKSVQGEIVKSPFLILDMV